MKFVTLSLIGVVIALTLFLSCEIKKSDSSEKNTLPNIIYILADDLGYGELGAYGQTKIETPHLDSLAQRGMLFTQHYAGAPVCAPSRAVLLTGKHSGHCAIRGNDEWAERGDVWNFRKVEADSTLEGQKPMPLKTHTIAKLLKDAGYRTGMIGKWGLGAPHSHSTPNKMGFDYYFGYNCQRQAHTYFPLHLYENEKRYHLPGNDTVPPHTLLPLDSDLFNDTLYTPFSQPSYAPEVLFEKLTAFLDSTGTDPFFLYWASPIPHVPLQAPQKWVDYYIEKFGDEEPYSGAKKDGSKNSGYFPSRYPRATYAAMVSYLDENVGKLVDYLKENGKWENTMILFASDNGPSYAGGTDSEWFNSGGPFDSQYGKGKGFLYEGGIRVPLIVSWPAYAVPGSTNDQISSFQDIMPTFCEIARIPCPPESDGISMLKTLHRKEISQIHNYLYWEFPEYGGQVAVRKADWKILWKNIHSGNTHIELYNLKEDPGEKNDLSGDFPELVRELVDIVKNEHTTPEIHNFRMEPLEHFLSH